MRDRRSIFSVTSAAFSAMRSRRAASAGVAVRKRAISAIVKPAPRAQATRSRRCRTSGVYVRRRPLRPAGVIRPRFS